MTAKDIIRFASTQRTETLWTQARSVPFRVEQLGTGLLYTLVQSQRARPEPLSALEKVVGRFDETGSLKPADYQKVTFNSSYTLALLKLFLDAQKRP